MQDKACDSRFIKGEGAIRRPQKTSDFFSTLGVSVDDLNFLLENIKTYSLGMLS